MSEPWLEIRDPDIDADAVQRLVEENVARREDTRLSASMPDPADVAESLYRERFGRAWDGPAPEEIVALEHDCDIVPVNYVIDWRLPVVGPIHALVRRVINAEIRRYLLPMLQKQSHLNRRMLQELARLQQENARLRQELERAGE